MPSLPASPTARRGEWRTRPVRRLPGLRRPARRNGSPWSARSESATHRSDPGRYLSKRRYLEGEIRLLDDGFWPDLFEQRRLLEQSLRVLHEVREQVEGLGRQRKRSSVAKEQSLPDVEAEGIELVERMPLNRDALSSSSLSSRCVLLVPDQPRCTSRVRRQAAVRELASLPGYARIFHRRRRQRRIRLRIIRRRRARIRRWTHVSTRVTIRTTRRGTGPRVRLQPGAPAPAPLPAGRLVATGSRSRGQPATVPA